MPTACRPATPDVISAQPYAADNGATAGHTRDKVKETLDLIKAWGFKVVRIWAFSNGPNKENIHTLPGGEWAHQLVCSWMASAAALAIGLF